MYFNDELARSENWQGPEERMAAYRQLLELDPDFKKEEYQSTPPTLPDLWNMVESGIFLAQMRAAECIEERL